MLSLLDRLEELFSVIDLLRYATEDAFQHDSTSIQLLEGCFWPGDSQVCSQAGKVSSQHCINLLLYKIKQK